MKTPSNIICDLVEINRTVSNMENVKDRLVYEVNGEEFAYLQAYMIELGHLSPAFDRTCTAESVKSIRVLGIQVREKS